MMTGEQLNGQRSGQGIAATDLIVGWQTRTIAKVPSLTVSPGSIIVVAGPNGAGKSTLVKTLARQIAPLSGQIAIDGTDVTTFSAAAFARRVAYVPQMINMLQDLTVRELVQLGRNPHQSWWSWKASDADAEAVAGALERTGTTHLRSHFLSSLSGGERQRAAIAMALAQSASFILLDEPTAHLDFKHQLELSDLIKSLAAQGIGLLLVLHDLNLMSRVADQILFLKKGAAEFSTPTAYGGADAVLRTEILRDVYDVEVQVFTDPISGQQNFVPTRVSAD